MKSFLCLSTLLLCAAVTPGPADEHGDWENVRLRITKVAGTVYMISMVDGTGGTDGGNIGASIGPDGIVLIDDMFAPLAPKIRAALNTVSDKPVRFVVNTHVHRDHTGGNTVFGATATIVAHANTRQQLSLGGPGPADKPVPAIALPVLTLTGELTLHLNGEDIRVVACPPGHSDTDLVVYFKQSNVVHMGDEFFSGMFPFIGRGGSVQGLIANIEKVLSEIPANAKIIPGHGPPATVSELRSTLTMLRETSAIVEDGIKKNRTLEQMTAAKALAKYDSWAGGYMGTDQYLEQLYRVLSR